MKTSQIVVAAGLCGMSSSMAAEQTADALPPMVVTADSSTLTAKTADADRDELAKTPGGAEVVEAERYLTGRASTVADTFALSPGVFAQSRFGSDEARLSIRGSGLQRTFHGRGLRLMQDGIPLNLADGGFDFQALDPLATDHINIWRGGNALAYGSSTLGGAIDYLSRTGRNDPGAILRVEAGSYGYVRAAAAGGASSGAGDVFASISHQSQDGFRDHAQQNGQRFFANAGWQFNPDLETRFYLGAIHTDSELPGNLTKAEMERDPQLAAPSNLTLDQQRNFDLIRLANKTTLRNGNTTWELSFGWTQKDLDHPIFQVIDQYSNDFLAGLVMTHSTDLAGHDNQIRAGVIYTYGITDAANYVNSGGHRGALVSGADQMATNLEGFIEDQFHVGSGFHLIAGASASNNNRKNDPTFGPGTYYSNDFDHVSPKAGFRWDGNDIQVFGNVSGSFEPPSFSESLAAGAPTKAQTATSFEIGTRGIRGPVRWDVTAYHAEIKNELLTIDHDNNPSTAPVTINADRTTHTGIEFGSEIDLFGQAWSQQADHRLVLRDAWTFGAFKFDNDAVYGDNDIAGLPQHLIRGELLWEHVSGWYAGPTIEWVPVKAYIDHRNTFSADPYAICGFKFGQRRAEGASWFVELRNLTDETYAATTGVIENANGSDQRQFLPGDGRSVFAGVEWKW